MLPETGKISMLDVWRELNPPIDPKDYDYYFETREDFDARRDTILAENNNDLSQKTFGFGDGVTSLNHAFKSKAITSTPKMIFARNVTDFSSCFDGCRSLTTIPQGLFDNCTNATDFSYCFYGCRSLTTIPQGLFDDCTNATYFSYCFRNCISLTTIPQGLFDNCTNATDFSGCFESCSSLTTIQQYLFDNCPNVTNFSYCFRNCISLTTIPEGLFDKNINVTDFSYCFRNCSNITSSLPNVWNKDKFPKVTDGNYYAYGCTKAVNYNEIPSNFGGPSTNPAVPLSIKQIEKSINKQTIITKSIEKIVDNRLPDGPIALGDTNVRELAGINDGQISLNDLHGKSIIKSCINITQTRNGSPADRLDQNLQLKDGFKKTNEGTYTKKQNVSEFNIYLGSGVGSWSSFYCNNCYEKQKKLKSFELRDVEHPNNTLTFVIENQKIDTGVQIYLLLPGER